MPETAESSENQRKKPNFLTLLSIVADVSAVVALSLGPHFVLFVVLAVLAFFASTFVIVRMRQLTNWRALLVFVGVLIMAVTSTVLILKSWPESSRSVTESSIPTTTLPVITSVNQAPQSSTVSSSSIPAPSTQSQKPVLSRTIKLKPGTGIDLDAAEPKVINVDGADGVVDIYRNRPQYNLPSLSYLRAGKGRLYQFSGSQKEAHEECAQLIESEQGSQEYIFAIPLMGACFTTTEGKTGWISVKEAPYDFKEVVVEVAVW